tara:strand:+ start:4785 stop:5372 length:588 start_codon:yes stop_codon:yes gene_type:complete
MNINDLQTGDLILFNGNYFLSRFIELITGSIYSHTAIIVKNPNFLGEKYQGTYILESGYEDKKDVENNRTKFGVQLTNFEELLKNYNGKIYVRKLNCQRNQDFEQKVIDFHSDVHNLPYDLNPIDWFKAKFNIDIGNIQKKNTFWCSALVSYFYVKLGFLTKDIPWTLIKPQDLSSSSNKLKFINCTLTDDTPIN